MIDTHKPFTRAFYRTFADEDSNTLDEIEFGLYNEDGSVKEVIAVHWVNLYIKIAPELYVFSDGWRALSSFGDLIELLGQNDNKNSTPEEFIEFLLTCGFEGQITPT